MNATNQFNGIVAEGFNWNTEQKLEQSFLNNFTDYSEIIIHSPSRQRIYKTAPLTPLIAQKTNPTKEKSKPKIKQYLSS